MVAVPSSLATKLKDPNKPIKQFVRSEPLWKGPEVDGVSQSLLQRFINCPERFRLRVVEGLDSDIGFNHRLEFGTMWHLCEEELAKTKKWTGAGLKEYCVDLAQKYTTQQDQVNKWYQVCRVTFPHYVKYWSEHPDVQERKPVLQEQVFDVPYKLPSGRVVILKGKFDAVDLIKKPTWHLSRGSIFGPQAIWALWLQENKTKGEIEEEQLKRQLDFDLQTMFYLAALYECKGAIKHPNTPIGGVRYNVIRRPLSGGAGTIRQHKPSKSKPSGETEVEYYQRLSGIIAEKPQDYFMRWEVAVGLHEVAKFNSEFLDPTLERLCLWWDWIKYCFETRRNPFKPDPRIPSSSYIHWRHPFGVYNVLNEGGVGELDYFLKTGSYHGMRQVDDLFPELKVAA